MSELIGLGGRVFTLAEQTTSRQDGWVMVQLEDAGILGLLTQGVKAFEDDGAMRSVIAQAIRSNKYHHIAAGLLVEVDKKWTPADAEQNAEFFAELTAPDDKRQIAAAFEGLLLGFFQNAVQSSKPSPTSSPTTNRSAASLKRRTRGKRSTATRAAAGPSAPDGSQTATATA